MATDEYFYKLKQKFPGINENIRQALVNSNSTCPATSICLSQLRERYYEITEERFPRMGDPQVEMLFILSVPLVAAFSNRNGTIRFYIIDESEAST